MKYGYLLILASVGAYNIFFPICFPVSKTSPRWYECCIQHEISRGIIRFQKELTRCLFFKIWCSQGIINCLWSLTTFIVTYVFLNVISFFFSEETWVKKRPYGWRSSLAVITVLSYDRGMVMIVVFFFFMNWWFIMFFRSLLKNLAKMNYQKVITRVWMIQVPLFMGGHSLSQQKRLNLMLLLIQWDPDEQQHGPDLEILKMAIQGTLVIFIMIPP